MKISVAHIYRHLYIDNEKTAIKDDTMQALTQAIDLTVFAAFVAGGLLLLGVF